MPATNLLRRFYRLVSFMLLLVTAIGCGGGGGSGGSNTPPAPPSASVPNASFSTNPTSGKDGKFLANQFDHALSKFQDR